MALGRVARGTVLELESAPLGLVQIDGENCTLRIGRGAKVHCPIVVEPLVRNAVIEIGEGCDLFGLIRVVRGDGHRISIGAATNIVDAAITAHETANITIGEDCMIGDGVRMDPSDMHPIYDRATGRRINPARDIEVGPHVWIGMGCLVLKGTKIGRGSMIGAHSVVSGAIPEHVIAAGKPSRILRRNIFWERDFEAVQYSTASSPAE